MKRQAMFFNTDHDFGGMILGICASMEEQKKLGGDIPDEAFASLKSGLMGPCAGVGDTLSQVVLIPILAVIFINLAIQGAVWAPIAYTVIFMVIFYGVGYWMLKVGYKSGGETVLKLMESGLLDKVIEVANILGCAVMGALVCNYVSFNWNVSIVQEGVELFNLQTGVFDAILPNAMPLLLTMGVYTLSKKGVKSSYVTFGVMLLGFILGVLGIIA
jgi:PTS system mannose-specific IID component